MRACVYVYVCMHAYRRRSQKLSTGSIISRTTGYPRSRNDANYVRDGDYRLLLTQRQNNFEEIHMRCDNEMRAQIGIERGREKMKYLSSIR